jgi:hypothetical protein
MLLMQATSLWSLISIPCMIAVPSRRHIWVTRSHQYLPWNGTAPSHWRLWGRPTDSGVHAHITNHPWNSAVPSHWRVRGRCKAPRGLTPTQPHRSLPGAVPALLSPRCCSGLIVGAWESSSLIAQWITDSDHGLAMSESQACPAGRGPGATVRVGPSPERSLVMIIYTGHLISCSRISRNTLGAAC